MGVLATQVVGHVVVVEGGKAFKTKTVCSKSKQNTQTWDFVLPKVRLRTELVRPERETGIILESKTYIFPDEAINK
jgi:hypothetical protein